MRISRDALSFMSCTTKQSLVSIATKTTQSAANEDVALKQKHYLVRVIEGGDSRVRGVEVLL
jgi:hypothetical protein